MLGSQNRKKESRMAGAKRQGREKPAKIEQRKVQGMEWGPEVDQTALLASPIYIGQAYVKGWGGEKNIKRGAKGPGVSLSSLRIFWVIMTSHLEDVFSFTF